MEDKKLSNTKHFDIQEASERSGLNPHTIRAWEKRYQAVVPKRAESGRRIYSESDLERLTLLSKLALLGNSIGQIAQLPMSDLNNIYLKTNKGGAPALTSLANYSNEQGQKDLEDILSALKTYDMGAISTELQNLKDKFFIRDITFNLFVPLISKIEELTLRSELRPAQVHALKALIKFHLGNMIYSRFDSKKKSSQVIALTSFEGDIQTTNLLLTGLLCSHYPSKLYYLNANLPAHSIIEAVKGTEATILILIISEERLGWKTSLDQIIASIKKEISIILVGRINSSVPEKVLVIKSLRELDHYLEQHL